MNITQSDKSIKSFLEKLNNKSIEVKATRYSVPLFKDNISLSDVSPLDIVEIVTFHLNDEGIWYLESIN